MTKKRAGAHPPPPRAGKNIHINMKYMIFRGRGPGATRRERRMKFVFNPQKNEQARTILMMRPTVAEARAALEKDDTDAAALYALGTALSLEKDY